MCDHGDTVPVRVRTAAHLSHTGNARWKYAQVDRCIASLVETLQMGGIDMMASCCGHNKGHGSIDLVDGRRLVIIAKEHFED